jgi:hypothetical protein
MYLNCKFFWPGSDFLSYDDIHWNIDSLEIRIFRCQQQPTLTDSILKETLNTVESYLRGISIYSFKAPGDQVWSKKLH